MLVHDVGRLFFLSARVFSLTVPQTEEEDFARACIDAFSAGMLSGVEEGTTLRAFLSKQLDCQPMRGMCPVPN